MWSEALARLIIEKRRRLIIFARFPEDGRVKTRLIPSLGRTGATELYRRLLLLTLRRARAFCEKNEVELEIRFDGSEQKLRHWLGESWTYRAQGQGDLGERMSLAFEQSAAKGAAETVIIGSDCPDLGEKVLEQAFSELRKERVVFGPAADGGYYLVGLVKPIPELFCGIQWSSEVVLAQSLEILRRLCIQPALLETLSDLDRPEDAAEWCEATKPESQSLERVSVIVPALNEAGHIETTLRSLLEANPHEIIVVDGGSNDGTSALATGLGVKLVNSPRGRARQMNAGAALATGNVLLFMHADTRLPSNWLATVRKTLGERGVVAGAFEFGIADNFWGKQFVEYFTNLRSRWLQNPYGDQTQFLRRALFEELGGFADLPLMEDYELNQRLRKRGRIVTAHAPALTSGRRWKKLGVFRTTLTNTLIIAGYHLGVSPQRLAEFYRGKRSV